MHDAAFDDKAQPQLIRNGDLVIVRPCGVYRDQDTEAHGKLLQQIKQAMTAEPATRFVVDFSNTPWFGARLTNVLLKARETFVTIRGGRMALCSLSEASLNALKITQIASLFEIFDDCSTASTELLRDDDP